MILAIDGVIREVVESAQGGIVVPPGDAESLAEAVQVLARDRQRSNLFGQNGRRYIKAHFDRPVVAEKLNVVLEQMVKNRD